MFKIYNNGIKCISYIEFDGVLRAFEDAYMSVFQDIKDETANKVPWDKLKDNYYIGNNSYHFTDYFLWFQKRSILNSGYRTNHTIKTYTTKINGKEYNVELVSRKPLSITDDNGLLYESTEFRLILEDNDVTYICDVEPSVEVNETYTNAITCYLNVSIYILADCELLVLNTYLNGVGHINYDFRHDYYSIQPWRIVAEKENFIQIVHGYYDEDKFDRVISIDNIEQLAYNMQ